MNRKTRNLSKKIILLIEVVLLISGVIFCAVSITLARIGIRTSIQRRMLDIANCASGSVDGDVLKNLTAEDTDTEGYRKVYDALAVFRDNVESEYVYGIKDEGDGRFTFTVDPSLNDPAAFGEEVKYTDALAHASEGTASVDEVPYSDAWGEFYSAYSPVFDSSGKIAGIIGVDFSVDWFDSQLSEQTRSTVESYVVVLFLTLFVGAVLMLVTVGPFVQLQEQLTEEVKKKAEENKQLLLQIAHSLVDAIDAKDVYTNGHSRRVAAYAQEIARRYGYSETKQNDIYIKGLLHDVGKIGVPDEIINKPARLTDEEFEQIKKHSVTGEKILKNIGSMPDLSDGARWHHEKYDGRGYPDGLAGEKIPEEERIIAVADAYDAMTSNRSYRKAMPQKKVRDEIEKEKGRQFDPVFADIMLSMIDEDVGYRMREESQTTEEASLSGKDRTPE